MSKIKAQHPYICATWVTGELVRVPHRSIQDVAEWARFNGLVFVHQRLMKIPGNSCFVCERFDGDMISDREAGNLRDLLKNPSQLPEPIKHLAEITEESVPILILHPTQKR